ncbi:PPE family protein [Mycobacterium tuberculosis]|nr:PPE family protein [Mycobacterium tuberculosis]
MRAATGFGNNGSGLSGWFNTNPAGLLGGSGYQNFGGLSSGFSNLGSGVSGFANRGILPFSVASVVSGFANIGTNLAGFFQGTTS